MLEEIWNHIKPVLGQISVLGIIGALWYRGRQLWRLYFTIVDDSLKQMADNSLGRDEWKELAEKHSSMVTMDFGIWLFEFDQVYLRHLFAKNRGQLCIPDSVSSAWTEIDKELNQIRVEEDRKYTDKPAFAKSRIKELYHGKFRFAGAGLFVQALKHRWTYKEKKGVVSKVTKKPLSQAVNEDSPD